MKNRNFLPAYSFAVLIFIFSSVPTGQLERVKSYHRLLHVLLSDHTLHFLAFGVLAGFLCFGFYKTKYSSLPYLGIGLVSLGFGLFIELYQIILPYRFFEFYDLISDFLGIILALVVFGLFMRNRPNHNSEK